MIPSAPPSNALRGAALGLLVWGGAAVAETKPPTFDVEETCRSTQRARASVNERGTVDGCLRSEREAGETLRKRWDAFTPAAKDQCSKQSEAGGFPSYVETLTCLELASGVTPNRDGATGPGQGAPPSGSSITREPSPAQRTDPIEVLERK